MKWHLGIAIFFAVGLTGCGDAVSSVLGPPRVIDRQPQPGDRRVRIDEVSMSDDKRTALLSFTGGRPFDPADPCSTDYVAVGEIRDGILEIAVIETVASGEGLSDELGDDGAMNGCDAMGHARTLELELAAAYPGSTVRDLAGYVRFVSAPDGLVELAGIPAGWTLRSEEDVEESPTGRWRRRYAPTDDAAGEGNLGVLDLYQAFGGPVNVSGGDDGRSVRIGDGTGTLYSHESTGELVLTWDLDGTGLALVANEADFPEATLIDLAESAVLPDS